MLLLLPVSASDFTSVTGTKTTSLVRLLAEPELYNGRQVEVTGYFTSGFERSGLFVSKESALLGDQASAVWVEMPESRSREVRPVTRGYVTIIGTFDSDPNIGKGHLALWPSEIRNVTLFLPTATRVDVADSILFWSMVVLVGTSCLLSVLAFMKCRKEEGKVSAISNSAGGAVGKAGIS